MRYCEDCGAPIPDGSTFCEECGAKIEPDTNETQETVEIQPTTTDKKSKKPLLWILIIIIIAAIAGVVVYFISKGNDKDAAKESTSANETEAGTSVAATEESTSAVVTEESTSDCFSEDEWKEKMNVASYPDEIVWNVYVNASADGMGIYYNPYSDTEIEAEPFAYHICDFDDDGDLEFLQLTVGAETSIGTGFRAYMYECENNRAVCTAESDIGKISSTDTMNGECCIVPSVDNAIVFGFTSYYDFADGEEDAFQLLTYYDNEFHMEIDKDISFSDFSLTADISFICQQLGIENSKNFYNFYSIMDKIEDKIPLISEEITSPEFNIWDDATMLDLYKSNIPLTHGRIAKINEW